MSGDRNISYLESMIRYCQDVQDIQNLYGDTYEAFLSNKGYQYSVSFCIEQIGEIAKKLRDEGFTDKYPDITWNEIAGLRNRIAHGYDSIDLEMVYDISVDDLPKLLRNCKAMLQQESQSKKADPRSSQVIKDADRRSMNEWTAAIATKKENRTPSTAQKDKNKTFEIKR